MNPVNHIDCTDAAVDLLGCLDGKHAQPDVRAVIAGSSAAEDSLQPLSLDFQRIFNWHFYNNGGTYRGQSPDTWHPDLGKKGPAPDHRAG